MLYDGERLMAIRADNATEALLGVFDDLIKATSEVASELWNNDADEVWNDL